MYNFFFDKLETSKLTKKKFNQHTETRQFGLYVMILINFII